MLWLLVSTAVLLAILLAGYRGLSVRRRLGEILPFSGEPELAERVSVVIPARNEAHNIERCVRSILGQTYPNVEIIVVDDGSEDSTAEIVGKLALRDTRIRLISGAPLPPGWKGKPHACWQGALVASGDWLCFIDADTEAFSPMLSSVVTYAQNYRLDMLSLHPFQVVGTFWERVLIPAGTFFLALMLDTGRLEDPRDPAAVANGQFILVRRPLYLAADGHRAVRSEILEDVMLARHLKHSGLRVAIRTGSYLIQTSMYTNLADMWEGLTKNSFDLLEGRLYYVAGALLAGLMLGVAPMLLPLILGDALLDGDRRVVTQVAFLFSLLAFGLVTLQRLAAVRYQRIPLLYVVTTPLAAIVASLILLNSVWRHRTGRGVTWKGRHYVTAN